MRSDLLTLAIYGIDALLPENEEIIFTFKLGRTVVKFEQVLPTWAEYLENPIPILPRGNQPVWYVIARPLTRSPSPLLPTPASIFRDEISAIRRSEARSGKTS